MEERRISNFYFLYILVRKGENVKAIPIDIITCPQWGAVKPKQGIVTCGRFSRFIFHHTAGHHREISLPKNESLKEAVRYARDIQRMHMAPGGLGVPKGGIDSGHNVLICRNGMILQGRWMTISAIQAGHMVVSAHCPEQNNQIGIEHEHFGDEPMTKAQRESSARFMAWAALHSGYKKIPPVQPHKKYFSTACPANLISDIPGIKKRADYWLSRALS